MNSSLIPRAVRVGVSARVDEGCEPIPRQLVDPVAVGQHRGLALLGADPRYALGDPIGGIRHFSKSDSCSKKSIMIIVFHVVQQLINGYWTSADFFSNLCF